MKHPPQSADSPWPIRAVIEGFYGPPWSWASRIDIMKWCADRGMTHYLYAPKDDRLHREQWREPYGPEMLDGFERLVGERSLLVGFGISPGLSIDYTSSTDRLALGAKVDQLVNLGVKLIALLFDDIPVQPELGRHHAELTTWLRGHLDGRAEVLLTPTEYTTIESTQYLDALAEGLPSDVAVGWTGPTVVCDEITLAQAQARSAALGGRRPFIWDNYPVNDAIMADRLFLGPLRGRSADLASVCSGYAANPMTQPQASKPALASIAGFLRGEDSNDAWEADIGDLRVFADACDGELPRQLVAAALSGAASSDGLDDLERWLRAARSCTAPGLEGEAEPWLAQVHDEASVGIVAVKMLRATSQPIVDGSERERVTQRALALAHLWPGVRRSAFTVMGPRCSFRPVLAQGSDGEWLYRSNSVSDDQNAIDALVRSALRAASQVGT